MKGKTQKREVESLETNEGKPGRNSGGSSYSVTNPTSGEKDSIHSTTELMEQLVSRPISLYQLARYG